jgi:hypothetical protein
VRLRAADQTSTRWIVWPHRGLVRRADRLNVNNLAPPAPGHPMRLLAVGIPWQLLWDLAWPPGGTVEFENPQNWPVCARRMFVKTL